MLIEKLHAFVKESNRIEGIRRRPKAAEVNALELFVELDDIDRSNIIDLVRVFQPDACLRNGVGMDVYVGSHRPPPGGPDIPPALDDVIDRTRRREHPYHVHHAYETLHPFTDGNGRSGRALWLWGMRRRSEREWWQALSLGFLHCWYYESLEFGGNRAVKP